MSEAAGVNSAGGSFGLSFGLAFAGAIMLASLSLVFTNKANSSDVLSQAQQEQVGKALEKNAEVMTNTHLEELLAGQPRGRAAGDPAHQHRRAPGRAPDRAARPAARRAARAVERLPDDAAPGSGALGGRRGHGARLTLRLRPCARASTTRRARSGTSASAAEERELDDLHRPEAARRLVDRVHEAGCCWRRQASTRRRAGRSPTAAGACVPERSLGCYVEHPRVAQGLRLGCRGRARSSPRAG